MRLLLVAVLASVLSLACKASRGDGAGDCGKIVDHALEIGIEEQGRGMNDDQRAKLVERVSARRAEAVEACKKRKPSKREEQCALAAATLAEMNACK